jgi:hypothetical protein
MQCVICGLEAATGQSYCYVCGMLIGLANLTNPVVANLMLGAGIGASLSGKQGVEIHSIMAQACSRAQELQSLMQIQNVLQQPGIVAVPLDDDEA